MFGFNGSAAMDSEWFPPAGPDELLWVNSGSAAAVMS